MAHTNDTALQSAPSSLEVSDSSSHAEPEVLCGSLDRLLVVRFGSFGDVVLMSAMMRRLHERFGATIDVLGAGHWTEALLRHDPMVGEIQQVGGRRLPYFLSRSQRAAVQWLRKRGPTPTWYFQYDAAGLDLLHRAGVPPEMICNIADLPIVLEHTARRWLRFADRTPSGLTQLTPRRLAPSDSRARLYVSEPMRVGLQAWLQRHDLAAHPLVLIQAGNKRTMRGFNRKRRSNTKYWPEERWAEVIRAVHAADATKRVVLLGSPGEHALNEDIRRLAAVPGVHNVARDLPIDILLPLLEIAHSLIGVDTGPAHAAAALGCPQVTLFGEASPIKYFPGGENTESTVLTGKFDGRVSMLGIQAQTVINAWMQLPPRTLTPATV